MQHKVRGSAESADEDRPGESSIDVGQMPLHLMNDGRAHNTR